MQSALLLSVLSTESKKCSSSRPLGGLSALAVQTFLLTARYAQDAKYAKGGNAKKEKFFRYRGSR